MNLSFGLLPDPGSIPVEHHAVDLIVVNSGASLLGSSGDLHGFILRAACGVVHAQVRSDGHAELERLAVPVDADAVTVQLFLGFVARWLTDHTPTRALRSQLAPDDAAWLAGFGYGDDSDDVDGAGRVVCVCAHTDLLRAAQWVADGLGQSFFDLYRSALRP